MPDGFSKQINFFRQFEPKTPERQYLSGETHLYLGKQYRLKVQSGETDSVKLQRGYFFVTTSSANDSETIKNLLDDWYALRAHDKFQKYFDRCWERFKSHSVNKPEIHIRRMKTRWGQLIKKRESNAQY